MTDDDLFAQLEAELGDVAIPDVDDVSALDGAVLLRRFHGVEHAPRDMGKCSCPRPTSAVNITPTPLVAVSALRTMPARRRTSRGTPTAH